MIQSDSYHFRSVTLGGYSSVRVADLRVRIVSCVSPTGSLFLCISVYLTRATMSGREALNMKLPPIQSTAGAVPIRNEKGEECATALATRLAGQQQSYRIICLIIIIIYYINIILCLILYILYIIYVILLHIKCHRESKRGQ